ncbi:MAG: NADH-quinone oxidoreductase subunit J [Thermoguttaceae bacterium]
MKQSLPTIVSVVLGALGMWLLLPRPSLRGRLAGAALAAAAAGLLASQLPGLAGVLDQALFYILAGVTVSSAAAAVSLKNPVYCAIWFAMTVLGTAGLFLLQGAQFLAVATIVVYAGAIVVTFLFVLMLVEPGARAVYDRLSWEGMLSAVGGAILIGVLSTVVGGLLAGASANSAPAVRAEAELAAGVLQDGHVAALGREMFGNYWIAVQAGGLLLLAALVGASAIVSGSRSRTASDADRSPPEDQPRAEED